MDSSFEWLHPEALILILPVCGLWLALALFARSRRRRAAQSFVAAAMLPRIIPAESNGGFWAKTILTGAAFAFALMALAQPRFGFTLEEVKSRGSDIYIMIDVSRSMLADDVPPSRLERAKADVNGLVNRLRGERVGLIAFAGVAMVKCPLTTDYNFFRMALSDLSPNSVPKGGTAIGDAISKALDVLPKENEREQAILLITDGDDQNSSPLEAAAAAAERSVTIFTVGLGDTAQGARIPMSDAPNHAFMAYKGEQVWSKMDEKLLEEIALKTHGTYVPARTRAYDLGELYASHLAKMRGGEGATEKRKRPLEQFQWFLAASVLCLIADLLIRRHAPSSVTFSPAPKPKAKSKPLATAVRVAPLLLLALLVPSARAGEERELVRQGLELFKKSDFEGAKERFSKAADEAGKDKEQTFEDAARVAFDLACAFQKKGEADHARENYLKSALAKDKSIAASSKFNLGLLASEAAKMLAGEHPDQVPPEKRNEILEKLKEAVLSFRACLEIQPDRADARKNIELIRLWTKLYTDKWRELDKRKAREQANLIQYLEFIMESERALRESVLALKPEDNFDIFALHKQAQQELLDEIGPLKDKIKTTLKPPKQAAQNGQPQQPPPPELTAEQEKQLDEAIAAMQQWAGASGVKMKEAAEFLDSRSPDKAAPSQKEAVAELEKIWDVVVPFNLLLAHDLASETAIVNVLKPEGNREHGSVEPLGKIFDWFDNLQSIKKRAEAPKAAPPPENAPPLVLSSQATHDEDAQLAELQERTSRRTELLKTKAEMELQQLEKQPKQPEPPPPDPNNPAPKPPDPEKVKEGLKKAIELAPKAVEHENGALKALRKNDRAAATPEAEEAKRILEEILKAQPRDEQKDKQDQEKKEQEKKEQEKKDQQKKDQEKKDQEKKDQEKKDQEKKEQEKKDQEKKDADKDKERDKEKKDQPKPDKQQMSKEQAEAILRKVREREQQHRKEKEEQARILGGSATVDKDW